MGLIRDSSPQETVKKTNAIQQKRRNVVKKIIVGIVLIVLLLPVWNVHVRGGGMDETVTTAVSGTYQITGSLALKEDSVITDRRGNPKLYSLAMIVVRVCQDPFRKEYNRMSGISLAMIP